MPEGTFRCLFTWQGVIRGCKLALKYMGKGSYGHQMGTKRGGVVLNISSVQVAHNSILLTIVFTRCHKTCSRYTQGLFNWPAMPTYSAGKSGLITYTRSAGHDLEFAQHGVKMICLCPHATQTPIQFPDMDTTIFFHSFIF